jgi:hypothetical protein
LIMSNSFGEKIASSLLPVLPSKTTIVTWKDIFREMSGRKSLC